MRVDPEAFQAMLDETIQDEILSRKERKALRAWLKDNSPNEAQLTMLRARVFDVARKYHDAAEPLALIEWIEDAVKALHAPLEQEIDDRTFEAWFSPGEKPRTRITSLLKACDKSVDICVFTITDDEIASVVLDTHRRGVKVRIISDNDKSNDLGSDIDKLARNGVPVAIDRSEAHMHHKFAVFDERLLLTGSYNWTRAAAARNAENILITTHPQLLAPYRQMFEILWERWGP